jgi:hypothetical protein
MELGAVKDFINTRNATCSIGIMHRPTWLYPPPSGQAVFVIVVLRCQVITVVICNVFGSTTNKEMPIPALVTDAATKT